ncbi:unnamed protein product (mitochondrion) [Plasmodiophora brassicae]|uniref:Uncharacterized protein n=1 Tax=Plasmodiophora brassicae TaxID=37360 RepID=A0A3P3YEM9_PLABS|nr:unnamed protein product [Plasmodiophora brassicae]
MSLARLVVLVVAVAILCAVDKPWVRRLRKAYSDHVGKQLANGRGIWKPLLITMLLKAGVDMVDRYIKGPVRPDGSPIRRQHAKRSVVRFALNTIIFAWAPLEFLFLTALPVVDRIIASLQ